MAEKLEKQAKLEQEELEQAKKDPKVLPDSLNQTGKKDFLRKVRTIDDNEGGVDGMSILKKKSPVKGNKLLDQLKPGEEFASMIVEISSVGDNFSEAAEESHRKQNDKKSTQKE